MKTLLLSEIATALGCFYQGDAVCQNISTDSRTIGSGSLFVAVVGDSFDGHQFVSTAFEKGAVAAVISDEAFAVPGKVCFVVKDTKHSYIQLGGLYRDKFDTVCVAITGSVGKTTTKDFIACALSPFGKTNKTQGNQNNEIGLPNTLFALEDDTKMLVAEMGMSGFGEIKPLSLAAKPQVAVITNIGVSHLQAMGTRENILKEKLDITTGLCGKKVLVVNSDNDLLSTVKEIQGVHIATVGIANTKADFVATDIQSGLLHTSFIIHHQSLAYMAMIPTLGEYNVSNALIATAVAHALGFDIATAVAGLANYVPSGMRQRVVSHGDITVIEDCYNASPDSMRAAISTLASHFGSGRKIAVLADMLELGSDSARMHEEIGQFVAQQHIDVLITFGSQAKLFAKGAGQNSNLTTLKFDTKEEIATYLATFLQSGDTLLFKGSNGMKLGDVIEQLYKIYPANR